MLSIQDLIEKAYKREDKYITVKIERMGGEIKLRVPSSEELYELKEKHKDYAVMASDLVYSSCVEPKLNDERLIQHFKCKNNPCDVVDKVFGFDGKLSIADILLDEIKAETNTTNKVELIKN